MEEPRIKVLAQAKTADISYTRLLLCTLAFDCEFNTLKDKFIYDRIVVGIADKKLSVRLQLDEALDLNKTTKMVIQFKEIKKQNDTISQLQLDKITSKNPSHVRDSKSDKNLSSSNKTAFGGTSNSIDACRWCGGGNHMRFVQSEIVFAIIVKLRVTTPESVVREKR